MSEYSGAKTRYINMAFACYVLVEIVLLNTVTERGTGTIIIDIVRLGSTTASLFSILYYMRMIPGVGHMFIYMQKTSTDLSLFGGSMFCVIFLFCRLEMLFVNTNSKTGCTPEFANIFISYYTVFLTFLNMQDYTQFKVISQGLLYMQHIVFVFVVGIMLYNLLIAISNDTVNHVYRDKEVMVSLGRLFATMEINVNIRNFARIGRVYINYFYKARVLNNFVCENGRVYLVRIKSSNCRLMKS